MTFDIYFPIEQTKDGAKVYKPGVKARPMEWKGIVELINSPRVVSIVKDCHRGNKARKVELPCVCWNGKSKTGHRSAAEMEPTQFVMADIDHCEDPRGSWFKLQDAIEELEKSGEAFLALAHVTPSGKGLRLVFRVVQPLKRVSEHLEWLDEQLHLSEYGDYDKCVKDLSRLSFLCMSDDLLYTNSKILSGEQAFDVNPIEGEAVAPAATETATMSQRTKTGGAAVDVFSDEEKEKFEAYDYRGTKVSVIIAKYMEEMGQPGSGEIHNFYNEMVKFFRCIVSNDKRALLYLLPRFGHSAEECWSQIVSICRVNTLSSLPKPFYFFLKDNGFYKPKMYSSDAVRTYMMESGVTNNDLELPWMPPVFREFVGSAPKDFVVPVMNALMPILGTLTSYVRATYPYDNREHSTSFFSVIYAPAGTGKGFVERFIDLLFEDLKLRDLVESERENVFLRIMQKKGANDKSPDMPHVSLRLIPPKNSEAEFLQKQRDNCGYHMFTYAAEMDSWAKGVRAAGGNKDDMIRIAWDNGEYGQQFKSFNTFKGVVRLYWNVLITGTIAQVESYFKNVENGLVTRCSFCSIDNQEFSEPPVWRKISKRGLETIHQFMRRCDENTYESPCTVSPSDLMVVNDDDFDKEIDWKFKFKPFKHVDMSWIMPTINAFHKEQISLAALDVDRARDTFRRRVAVRGFRLAMLCTCLWEKPRESDLKKCIPFINWWMHVDLDNMLKLWGARYNEQTDVMPDVSQRSVFSALGETFTKSDVYTVCVKQGIKTPVRRILFDWRKIGCIEQVDKENYKKAKNYVKSQK